MLTADKLQDIKNRALGATPAPQEPTPYKEIWMIDHLMSIVQAYRTDVPALVDDLTELHAKVKLFTDSFTLASRLWHEKHPDNPNFPDGPENMVWAIEELEQYYKVARSEQESDGIIDKWIARCGELEREKAAFQAKVAGMEKTTLTCAAMTAQTGFDNDALRKENAELRKERDASRQELAKSGFSGDECRIVFHAYSQGRIPLGANTFIHIDTLKAALGTFQAKHFISWSHESTEMPGAPPLPPSGKEN